MRLIRLLKPGTIKKGIRFLNYLGPRLLIHALMDKLRGRTLFFYNEERILDDNSVLGYNAIDSQASKQVPPGQSTIHNIKPISPNDFLVSIIVPSDNLENITKCVENLVKNTAYPNYEIVIVANSETAKQLEGFRIPNSEFRIHTFDKPFNFSEKCNVGAAAANGNVLCFYNDDICPIDSDWIEHMLQALILPGVGGVTPLQMLDTKSVLTAGNVLSIPGLQSFAFSFALYTPSRNLRPDQLIVRDVSSLSDACLLIKKEIFSQIGMFNAENTPNSLSDLEISFKIRHNGYRCVITPGTRMLHENNDSRRTTDKPDKAVLYMMEKWGKYFAQDVFFTERMKILYKITPQPCMYPIPLYNYYAPKNIIPRKSGGRNILFISHELSLTGAPIALLDMVKVVIENGDWPVIIGLADGPLRQSYLDMGVTVILDNLILDLTESSAFAFDYVARNFDVVIVNTLACWRTIEVLSNSLPPVLWWVHESPLSVNPYKSSLPDKLSANINIYAVSDYCTRTLRGAGVTYDFAKLAYGVPDFSNNTDVNHSQSPVTFMVVGLIDHRKAQDVLIKALKYIDKRILSKSQFFIIGYAAEKKIHKICKRGKAKHKNIIICDKMPREQVLEWYKKADCLIVPSREDPLPIVATEAMMFSKPVICSDHTGTADYINQYENGIVFPSEDSEALAEHIMFAINNRDKMTKMGRRARKEIYEAHFTMGTFKINVLHAIDEVINER